MAMPEVKTPFSWWKLARTLLGLIVAPIVGGTLCILPFAFGDLASGNGEISELAGVALFGAYFGGFMGIPTALLVGLPLHLGLLRMRWTSIWFYVGLGALIGIAAFPLGALILEPF